MKTTFSALLCVMLAVLVSMTACSKKQDSAQAERVLSIKAAVVHPGDREITRSFTGSIEGERQADLYAKLAEAVDSLWVQVGDRVQVNQVVLSLDREGPSSQYREAHSTFLNAEKSYKKMENLYSQGAVSEYDFDAVKTAYEISKANFEAVSKMVEIQTPIAGKVTALNVSPGDMVMAGQKLATVAATGRLRVRFGVSQDEIGFFSEGAEVRITSKAVNANVIGRVATISTSADPATRAYEVEALFDNRDGSFSPGMFVTIDCILERLAAVIAIPRSTVLLQDGRNIIYTVVNGVAQRREISLGPDLSGNVVVTSGLAAGDTLVTLGQDYLKNNLKVKISELSEL
jgi:membrane fusion protein, multidrug efflux system